MTTTTKLKYEKPGWKILYTANGVHCDRCGGIEYPYVNNICNAHTSGLTKMYGHPELQVIIDCGPQMIGYILNSLSQMVKDGRIFSPGDHISGLFEGYDVRIDDIKDDSESEHMLRVVIPDSKNRFPDEEGCEELYVLQLWPLDFLKRNGGTN